MTDITPILATTGSVYVDGTLIGGVSNVKFGDKNVMKDITVLGDTAKKNYPTIQDWNLSFDIKTLKTDAGQVKLRASKSAKTRLVYLVYLAADMLYTCEGGYVEGIDYNLGSAEDLSEGSVTISAYGTATFSTT
jgi:hypothetical protein